MTKRERVVKMNTRYIIGQELTKNSNNTIWIVKDVDDEFVVLVQKGGSNELDMLITYAAQNYTVIEDGFMLNYCK